MFIDTLKYAFKKYIIIFIFIFSHALKSTLILMCWLTKAHVKY